MSGKLLLRFGVSLAVALVVPASCGDPCPSGCPAASFYLDVTNARDGGQVTGVEATLSGPTTVTMPCKPEGTETFCFGGAPVTAGSYSLQVTAPGFQTVNVPATVTLTSDSHCGCQFAMLQPSTLALDPSGDPDAAMADAADSADGGAD